ncbi:MAG: response regulator [Elusimicrobiota bacterium]
MPDKKLILAVDDDASVCDIYEKGLPIVGFDVVCASSAGKCREALKKHKPDAILMDIMMPDQDGISLTQEIRSDPETAHIPILVVSGLSDAATLNDAILFGAIDYVVKPIDVEIIKNKLDRIFELMAKG